MKLIKIVLLLQITFALGFASEAFERILITKTTKKSALHSIKKTLDNLGVKMYVQTLSSGFYVYSPKYYNQQNTLKALKRIKRKFPYAKIVVIKEDKKEKEQVTQSTHQEDTQKTSLQTTKQEKKFYAGFNLGFGSTSGTTNSVAASNLANSGLSYAFEGGYKIDDEISVSLTYLDLSTDDISMYDIFAEVNYLHPLQDGFSAGGGLILGFSSLEIDSFASSTPSTNIVYGYDLAVSYRLQEELDIYIKYQGLFKNHTITIDNTSDVTFDYTHNSVVGVWYRF